MDHDEFYSMALDPYFPEEMLFELSAEDPDKDKTFSSDGLNVIADQMYDFMLARTFAFWKKKGKPARRMRAYVTLKFLDEEGIAIIDGPEDNGHMPYFGAGDVNGLSILDGTKRIPRQRGVPLEGWERKLDE